MFLKITMKFREAYVLILVCIYICVYSNSCRFVNFYTVNKLLVNSTFLVVQNIGIFQCAKLCLDHSLCSAVSYLRSQLKCQLNYFNDTTAPELLVHFDKGVYLSLNDVLQEFGLTKLHACPLNTRYITTKRKRGICMEFDQLKNIAVGKTTNQSSIYLNKVLANGTKAVDGVWDSDYYRSGCFISILEPNPWWSVDLQLVYPVVKIIMQNRLLTGYRLQNIFIFAGLHVNEMEEFGTFPGPGTNGQRITLSRSVPKFARFIKIEQRTKNYLQLCEVGIYTPYAEK